MDELEPCHVELCGGGSSPLPGFEEDEAYGEACSSFFFESGDEDSLRIAEAEKHVRASILIVNPHKGGCPEWEVVAISESDEFFGYFVAVGVVGLYAEYV